VFSQAFGDINLDKTAYDLAYLQRILQMDPLEQPVQILAVRAAWQNNQEVLDLNDSLQVLRIDRYQKTAKQIAGIRDQFWKWDQEVLQQQLESISADEFPDLKVAVLILCAVSTRRDSFRRLQTHPACFPEFLETFQKLLVASPRQAVALRDELETASLYGLSFPACRSPREFQRIARVIQDEFPELAALQNAIVSQLASGQFYNRLMKSNFFRQVIDISSYILKFAGALLGIWAVFTAIDWITGALK
jgi:hypothetical protein